MSLTLRMAIFNKKYHQAQAEECLKQKKLLLNIMVTLLVITPLLIKTLIMLIETWIASMQNKCVQKCNFLEAVLNNCIEARVWQ